MCLGIPGQITSVVDRANDLVKVDISGVQRTVSVQLLADEGWAVGEWVLIHVGFAMSRIDEDEARTTLEQIQKLGREFAGEVEAFNSSDIV